MRLRSVSSFSLVIALSAVVLLGGCDTTRRLTRDVLDQRTPRERYLDGLSAAGLAASALARDWIGAGDQSLQAAPSVSLPYLEEGYLPPGEPGAVGLRARVRRGQELRFAIDLLSDTTSTVFIDAWLVDPDSASNLELLEYADSGAREVRIRPRKDADVILRAQPELLRGGRFRITIETDPTLKMPVRSAREYDIGSRWGASRDGGVRRHEGIDIFARRGTPVVAAAPGVVRRVAETPVGGKVIWQVDRDGNRLYYAHLDRQVAVPGMNVEVGDTIGFVGNTGNARTTPPHLHFGVYRRGEGAVDPWWFVHRPRGRAPGIVADTTRWGTWIRLARPGTKLRRGPDSQSDTLPSQPRYTAMRVVSVTGSWYRVRLPDGTTGFVTSSATESTERPVRTARIDTREPILTRPSWSVRPGGVLAVVGPDDSLDVLGLFGDFLLVRSGGVSGWMTTGS